MFRGNDGATGGNLMTQIHEQRTIVCPTLVSGTVGAGGVHRR